MFADNYDLLSEHRCPTWKANVLGKLSKYLCYVNTHTQCVTQLLEEQCAFQVHTGKPLSNVAITQ